jgi:hypothetical protein
VSKGGKYEESWVAPEKLLTSKERWQRLALNSVELWESVISKHKLDSKELKEQKS